LPFIVIHRIVCVCPKKDEIGFFSDEGDQRLSRPNFFPNFALKIHVSVGYNSVAASAFLVCIFYCKIRAFVSTIMET